MDLPGEDPSLLGKKQPVSTQLRFCSTLIRDLFSKKHAVRSGVCVYMFVFVCVVFVSYFLLRVS